MPTKLTVKYSSLQIFFMCISVCIGVGIFIIPTAIHALISPNIIGKMVTWAFVLGSIPAFASAFISGLCSSLWPSCGGDYTYYKRAIHPILGFLVTWCYWVATPFQIQAAVLLAGKFIAIGLNIAGYTYIAAFIEENNIAFAFFLIMVGLIINLMRWEGFTAPITCTCTLILSIIFISFTAGHTTSDFHNIPYENALQAYINTSPDFTGFITGIFIIMFAYGGITHGQNAGEECTKNFSSVIWKIFLYGLSFVSIYYISISYFLYKSVPWEYIASQANIDPDFSVIKAISYYVPQNALAIGYVLLAIVIYDNVFILGFRSARQGLTFARDEIFPSMFCRTILGGPGYSTLLVYGFAVIILFFVHYIDIGFIANYSYALGLTFAAIVGLSLTELEIKRFHPNIKIWKIIIRISAITSIVFYTANLLVLIVAMPNMTLWWLVLGFIGIIIYILRKKKNNILKACQLDNDS